MKTRMIKGSCPCQRDYAGLVLSPIEILSVFKQYVFKQ